MKSQFLIILLFIFCFSKLPSENEEIEARVRKNEDGTLEIITSDFSETENYVAYGYYKPTLTEKGWDSLAIQTNGDFNDDLQAEAAGRLEGYLTYENINAHYKNLENIILNFTEPYIDYFTKQEDYIKQQYKEKGNDPHVQLAYLMYLQFDGLRNEYNKRIEEENKIDDIQFHLMAAFGDLIDIKNKINRPKWSEMSFEELQEFFFLSNHCSAIFKLVYDLSDIYVGHNSWYYYSMMTRIFKEYNFNFKNEAVKAHTIYFTSYPASLSSNDDYYVTSKDLFVVETTNSYYNDTFFDLMVPETFPCWIRVMVANRMSITAEEWGNHFSPYNSGTYNNQYMILDMKKVDLNDKKIDNKAMYIVEQIPEYIAIDDVTEFLKFGYWPSYNTPYDSEVQKRSNIAGVIEKYPHLSDSIGYDNCARANIFRRDQGAIVEFDDFKKLMRSNYYKTDPLSKNKPTYAISARGDLDKSGCYGAYDAKAAKVSEVKGKNKKFHLIAGPTYNEQINPLKWNETCNNLVKNPKWPNEFKYDWYEFTNKFENYDLIE